jgi:hypothetical protein
MYWTSLDSSVFIPVDPESAAQHYRQQQEVASDASPDDCRTLVAAIGGVVVVSLSGLNDVTF